MNSCKHIRMKLTLFGRFKCRDCGERFDVQRLEQMTELLRIDTEIMQAKLATKSGEQVNE